MSLRRPAAALPPHPHAERIQREHELSRALEAARTLQARLEMLDGHEADVRSIRELRNKISGDLAQLDHLIIDETHHIAKNDKPIVGHVVTDPPYEPDHDEGGR